VIVSAESSAISLLVCLCTVPAELVHVEAYALPPPCSASSDSCGPSSHSDRTWTTTHCPACRVTTSHLLQRVRLLLRDRGYGKSAVPVKSAMPCSAGLCSAIVGCLHRKRVGAQTTRTELGAKQHWTLDFRAGIIARDNNPSLRGTPWL
jgi:hypothetical protein